MPFDGNGTEIEQRLRRHYRVVLIVANRTVRPTQNSRLAPQMLGLRIGAALEGGAVVVGAAGVVAGRLLFGLFSFGAERGLAGGVVAGFAGEHDAA